MYENVISDWEGNHVNPTWVISKLDRGMPSLYSLVVRRAFPMEMGSATSSVASSNTSKANSSAKKSENGANKLNEIRLPLLRKDTSVINLSGGRKVTAQLLRPESSTSLESRNPSWNNLALRKCETTVGLSTLTLDNRPINRSRVCSRCSSLLSLASSSRYSLAAGNFVPTGSQQTVLCKICLIEVSLPNTATLEQCGCAYCKDVSIKFQTKFSFCFVFLTLYLPNNVFFSKKHLKR